MSEDFFDVEAPTTIFRFKSSMREPAVVDVIAAQEAMDGIEKDRDKKFPDGDAPTNWKLDQFAAWLRSIGQPFEGQDAFSKGELDSLWHGVLAAYLKKKKRQNDVFVEMQTSPSSTGAESIPGSP